MALSSLLLATVVGLGLVLPVLPLETGSAPTVSCQPTTANGCTISWSAVGQAESYRVVEVTDGSVNFALGGCGASSALDSSTLSCTPTGLLECAPYTIALEARNGSDTTTSPSTSLVVTLTSEVCGTIQGLTCPDGKTCTDDPSDACEFGVHSDCKGYCTPDTDLGPPISVVVSKSGRAQLEVAWDAPADVDGMAQWITTYTITYQKALGGATQTTDVTPLFPANRSDTAFSHTITGLDDETSYNVTVTAANCHSASATSTVVQQTTVPVFVVEPTAAPVPIFVTIKYKLQGITQAKFDQSLFLAAVITLMNDLHEFDRQDIVVRSQTFVGSTLDITLEMETNSTTQTQFTNKAVAIADGGSQELKTELQRITAAGTYSSVLFSVTGTPTVSATRATNAEKSSGSTEWKDPVMYAGIGLGGVVVLLVAAVLLLKIFRTREKTDPKLNLGFELGKASLY
eukprot:m.78830 g.78830  ORF g.78830 m.78830 type:complete len:458 (+) comp14601_c0_seq1:211-1584(+)